MCRTRVFCGYGIACARLGGTYKLEGRGYVWSALLHSGGCGLGNVSLRREHSETANECGLCRCVHFYIRGVCLSEWALILLIRNRTDQNREWKRAERYRIQVFLGTPTSIDSFQLLQKIVPFAGH